MQSQTEPGIARHDIAGEDLLREKAVSGTQGTYITIEEKFGTVITAA